MYVGILSGDTTKRQNHVIVNKSEIGKYPTNNNNQKRGVNVHLYGNDVCNNMLAAR